MKRNKFIKTSLAVLTGSTFLPINFKKNIPYSNLVSEVSELWQLSATEMAGLVARNEISVTDVVHAHLARIKKINPIVNAASSVLEEQALKLARQQDIKRSQTRVFPKLFGVPFSIKDNIDLSGSPTTDGVRDFANNIVASDAPQVASLKNEGAIPLIRTNMPDFALRYHTESQLNGTTLNPWNRELTCGGSSGGDAVAVATGMVPLGLGNDYGGSLRYPAQCNGVCAIRPTRGRVPYYSSTIPHNNLPHSVKMFAVQGPIARTVDDLQVALDIISTPDYRDPGYVPIKPSNHLKKQYKIAMITNPGNYGVDTAVSNAVLKAGRICQNNGCIIEEIDSYQLRESMELWAQIVTTDVRNIFISVLNDHASTNALKFVESFLNLYPALSIEEYVNALSRVNGIMASWGEAFQNYDAVIGPISSRQPFKIGYDVEGVPEAKQMLESQSLSVTVNLLGLPSISIPVEVSDGLPHSVQIICPSFYEDRCFDIARMIEKNVGNFVPITPRYK